ncbi:MAG: hypothetical protein OEW49_04740 [Nitrosopumilus sp.]|nr:hypothetical protein [Nitrosopumilus sp.]
MDESILRRLSFIKYIYGVGVEQSNRSEPLSSVSILSFHDSAELFLQLASEYLNASKNENGFMSYWEVLKEKLPLGEITQKESMRRLNKSRVQLKHNGTLPSKLDIESFRATITNFFNENTLLIFNIEFDSISMIDVIQNQQVKDNLKKAQELMNKGKSTDCLKELAKALAMLIKDYEERKRDEYGQSPFFFGHNLSFNSSFFMGIDGKLGDFVDKVKESLESIQDAIKVLSLGFDYKRYAKFKLLTPNVIIDWEGNYVIGDLSSKKSFTKDDCKFCFDYVIDSAIRLQDFDFDIKKMI